MQYPGFSIPPNPACDNTRVRLQNTKFKHHSCTASVSFTSVALGCIFSIQAPQKLRHGPRKRLKRSLFQLFYFITESLGGVCGALEKQPTGTPAAGPFARFIVVSNDSASPVTGKFFRNHFRSSNSAVTAETASLRHNTQPPTENTLRPRKSGLLAWLA